MSPLIVFEHAGLSLKKLRDGEHVTTPQLENLVARLDEVQQLLSRAGGAEMFVGALAGYADTARGALASRKRLTLAEKAAFAMHTE